MTYVMKMGRDGQQFVTRDVDGAVIPFDPGNRDYAAYLAWVAAGNTPSAEPVPPPTADDVRAEASRRMQVLFGARDAGHLELTIANASREAIRLLRIKGDRPWTAAEATRAAELEAADAALEAIRAASNAMEGAPPEDYREDRRWPAA